MIYLSFNETKENVVKGICKPVKESTTFPAPIRGQDWYKVEGTDSLGDYEYIAGRAELREKLKFTMVVPRVEK